MSHASVLVVVDGPRDLVEDQVNEQMAPFQEESWFENGSRWDWFQIGGRYTGKLSDYDPETDPENQQVCDLCHGTGKRLGMECENGCNGCQGKGVHTKWPTQWRHYDGDIQQVRDLRQMKPEKLAAYAFLTGRHWHEAERLGWFGRSAATECELKDADYPLNNSKCLYTDEQTGARIINWQEPYELWAERFWQRFIEPLRDEQWIVVVDYHV
jgi:hypothetical protein